MSGSRWRRAAWRFIHDPPKALGCTEGSGQGGHLGVKRLPCDGRLFAEQASSSRISNLSNDFIRLNANSSNFCGRFLGRPGHLPDGQHRAVLNDQAPKRRCTLALSSAIPGGEFNWALARQRLKDLFLHLFLSYSPLAVETQPKPSLIFINMATQVQVQVQHEPIESKIGIPAKSLHPTAEILARLSSDQVPPAPFTFIKIPFIATHTHTLLNRPACTCTRSTTT